MSGMPLHAVTRAASRERFRWLARTTALVSVAALVAFHGWLFAAQAAVGRLEDPWLAVRWMVAAGLVSALAAVRRSGASIWSRQGLAVWVLAALMHGPAVATDFTDLDTALPLPEAVATSVLQSLVAVSALAITLWMFAGVLGRRDRHARLDSCLIGAVSPAGFFRDGFSPQDASRPPPRQR